jgi:hypothetical protein
MVSIGSFDTHAAQVNTNAKETGTHANLLMQLSDGIKAFMDDLKGLNASKRVIGMTFSEFGRRIKSNASNGTDHGAAAPLFLFGDYVKNGVLGKSPTIGANVTVSENIPMQYDFRAVYASLLQEWFCVDQSILNNVMLADYQSLPMIKSTAPCESTSPDILNATAGQNIIYNYPNPFSSSTTINFRSEGGHVRIQIFNIMGALLTTLVDKDFEAGRYDINFESSAYPTGAYFAHLQNGSAKQVRTMMVVR